MTIQEKDEWKLIASVLGGHTDDFSYFLERYGPQVFSVISRLVPVQEDAEELAQETFISAFTHLADFAGQAAFSSWLYRIAYNKAMTFLRGHAARHTLRLDDMNIEAVDESLADEALSVDTEERIAVLNKAVGMLSADERMLVTMFYMEEHTAREVAYIMGITERNVIVRLHRVRKKLYLLIKRMENGNR